MSGTNLKVVVNRNTPGVVATFSRLGDVLALETNAVNRETVRDADLLIVRSETTVDRELLEGSRVRFVGTVTIGTDHIDLDYLQENGIAFASAPGSNSTSVAEYVTAALLTWSDRSRTSLKGKILGVVGVGNVGSKVAGAGEALGMRVVLNDPPRARQTGGPIFLPLDRLMESDFLSLHVPLTKSGIDATYHLFDERRIRAMKPSSVLLNTSRGGVVETAALTNALVSKRLSGAVLDVWEGEPAIDTDLLARVTLGTPHIAGYSLDGKLNAVKMVYEEACRFLNVSADWNTGSKAGGGDLPGIEIPATLSDPAQVVRRAVQYAYDIELDDTFLRRIEMKNEGERGYYFMKLRAEYRIRREFARRTVLLSREQNEAREVLEKLGFVVAAKGGGNS